MIKAIIFDFDGVILESAEIKTTAFGKLFEAEHPDKTEAIVNYHMRNMGISRYVKFRYIYENILKLPLSQQREEDLGKKFSDIVLQEILLAPFVPGALEFLVKNRNKYLLFIASGTPEEELRHILKERQISHLFDEALGTPAHKTEIIRYILHKYSLHKEEIVFVGDAESDLIAAEEAGVSFIARITQESSQDIQGCCNKITDLTELVIT